MRRIEAAEDEDSGGGGGGGHGGRSTSGSGGADPGGSGGGGHLHLAIVNLVIGTLYCSKARRGPLREKTASLRPRSLSPVCPLPSTSWPYLPPILLPPINPPPSSLHPNGPPVQGNFEFGISRVIKSLDPLAAKLSPDTWYYAKRPLLALAEGLAKRALPFGDEAWAEVERFLAAAEAAGRRVPAAFGGGAGGGEGRTVGEEARELRWMLARLAEERWG
jgi:hypothetical protein